MDQGENDEMIRLGRRQNSKNSKSKSMRVNANFIRTVSVEESKSKSAMLKTFMNSLFWANFMAFIVVVDAVCTSADINARAADSGVSETFAVISDLCLALYTIELSVFLCISDCQTRLHWTMLMDIAIIGCGWAERLIQVVAEDSISFRITVLRPLRLVRIFRLLRSLKRLRPLRELHKLATMMATCFRTLLWSFLLCFVVMTVWAMLMVELIYPALLDMNRLEGTFEDCGYCQRAMSTVMDANLLLFQTVIAGDSWGKIAIPVIQRHPATAIIFVGSLLTLVFGVLNLIVAVVVDTFADARINDVQSLAEEMEEDLQYDRQILANLFARIDKDGSGELSLPELMEGARTDPQFHSRLRVMDIDESDLEQLFYMIDSDKSGTVTIEEFIGPLSRWAHDSKTAPRFIKYNLLHCMNMQEDLYDLFGECFDQLAGRIDEVRKRIDVQTVARATDGQKELKASQDAGSSDDDKPTTVPNLLELSLEAAMHKIEAKLDLMMERTESPTSITGFSKLRSEMSEAMESASLIPSRPRKPFLRPDPFTRMYMRREVSPRDRIEDGGWTQSLGLSLGLSSQKGRKRRSLRDAEAKMEPTEPAGPWPSTTIQEVSRRGSVSPQSQLPNTRDL